MKPSKPFLKTGMLGLLVIALSMGLTAVFPAKAPNLPDGFSTPIIAFEFIKTPVEAAAMFVQADEAGRESVNEGLLAAFDLGNRLDYLYMLLYCGFLMKFSLTCARLSGKTYFYIPAGLSLVVLVGDAFENIQLFGITASFRNRPPVRDLERLLECLGWFTWLKWGGIAVLFLTLAPWFWRGGRVSKAVGLWGVMCAGLGLAAFVYRPVITEIFCLWVGLMFLWMIIYCFRCDGSEPYCNPRISR